MNFESKSIMLQTFFTDKKYIIPRYQREYSWTKEELEVVPKKTTKEKKKKKIMKYRSIFLVL